MGESIGKAEAEWEFLSQYASHGAMSEWDQDQTMCFDHGGARRP